MNVMTIDFDIILHWSLNIYNNSVGSDEDNISDLLKENPNAYFTPRCDFGLYEYLTSFLIKCIKILPKDNIKFIEDHDEVVELFDPTLDIIKPTEKFKIYNIDFHHDIAYDEDDIDEAIEEIDCGNWIKYLFENYPNFESYIWINTSESLDYDDEYSPLLKKVFTQNINKYNLDALVKKIDYLYICKSPEWVPIDIQFLYEVWKDIYEEFTK